jgi:putative transposase
MPWRETSPMDQKTQFIADYLRETRSGCELCDLYGISRKTAYKWIDRYLKHGPAGLHDRSRKPGSAPHHTPEHIIAALLQARSRHPTWGAKKLLPLRAKRFPAAELPSRTTVFDILGRPGRLAKKRQRRRIGHPGAPTSTILAPNDGWSADFKGQFKTGDGRYCYPLTVTDGDSRYLLGCQAFGSTAVHEAKPVLIRLFKAFGLPKRIRTNNGVPFATNTLARLSS